MRTTVTLYDDLLESASAAIGVAERAIVLREGLKALIERQAARRLARLGGTDPDAKIPARRRSSVVESKGRPGRPSVK